MPPTIQNVMISAALKMKRQVSSVPHSLRTEPDGMKRSGWIDWVNTSTGQLLTGTDGPAVRAARRRSVRAERARKFWASIGAQPARRKGVDTL